MPERVKEKGDFSASGSTPSGQKIARRVSRASQITARTLDMLCRHLTFVTGKISHMRHKNHIYW
jgi:hypothetical protein